MTSSFKQVTLNRTPLNIQRVSRKSYQKASSEGYFEWDRISEDYIKQDYLDHIYSRKSAEDAINSLLTNHKRGLISDFYNLIRGAGISGKEDFINKLMDKYGKSRIDFINSHNIKTKSGKFRSGYKFSSRTYLIVVKGKNNRKYVQARRFKDNKIVKFRKTYLKNIS